MPEDSSAEKAQLRGVARQRLSPQLAQKANRNIPQGASLRKHVQRTTGGATYVLYEFPDHPVPLALLVLGAVSPVGHQADLVREAQDVGQLSEQVDAEPFEPVVPNQRLVRLLKHDVWLLLQRPQRSNGKQRRGQRFQFVSARALNWGKVIRAAELPLPLTGGDSGSGAESAGAAAV